MRSESLTRRLTVLSFALVGVSLILLVRLLSFQFYMDPTTKQDLESNAQSHYSQTVEVQPNRGQIYDRSMNLLAVNSYEYRIGISPNAIYDREDVARELAPIIDVPEDEIYRKLLPGPDGTFASWVMLAARVDDNAGQQLMDLDIDGVTIDPLPIRVYPQGALTGQIVGFFAGSESASSGQGYWGVEGYYQTVLAGQSKKVTKSNIPVVDDVNVSTQVRDGIDLVLTIDRDVQYLAQEILDKAVAEQGASGGTILIMNPRTGEILAIANNENGMTFDPYNTSSENMDLARNPAVSDLFEPGSIFKLVTMSIALEAGTHDESWTYHDPGCFTPAGTLVCNWDSTSRGDPSFAQVFIDSLNTGTATIFMEMGRTKVYPLLDAFGIGQDTGVDIQGEQEGLLPEPGDSDWNESQFITTSFGQGVSITPLQMLTAANAIANDGMIMQPHIVKARIDGDQVIETQPVVLRRPISADTAHRARDIMVQIVSNPSSVDLLDVPGYTVAGKTGTAQIPIPGGYDPSGSIASFIGFLPADDPVVSILVKLDRPRDYWGSAAAAPVFEELSQRLVVLMEIMPDDERRLMEAEGGNPFEREY
ncbi:MAG TPA: penicillin-binding protein 2 [Aggregatilinea sp.]|uniref:peptidoglycan D,D-transpeptidase FtsI family protein n=1 Tax=Aggregatilinea sp. TaxID=2806333 RepID=UPI002B9EF4D6|nr:penicillin-binding protein 2 [Aggregatilinea sp.]HML22981.1 penicillin-binding protein 2 [Aggregatilinea sp.]